MYDWDATLIAEAVELGKLNFYGENYDDTSSPNWYCIIDSNTSVDCDFPEYVNSIYELTVEQLTDYAIDGFDRVLDEDRDTYEELIMSLRKQMI
jgi:hypothetical protein